MRIAAIQMCSGDVVADNLATAAGLLRAARESDAGLAVLPENFALMPGRHHDRLAAAESAGAGPIQDFLRGAARELGLWIVGGTFPLRGDDGQRVRGTCLVVDDNGEVRARFDKLHLFDVEVAEGESYAESGYTEHGDRLAVVDTPAGRLAPTVCYDMRFPELYRALVDRGAQWFTMPSAFTVPTGEAHWEVLLRARAIENVAYVVAPAQWGRHPNGRRTYGHSMIVDPWGEVLGCRAQGAGVLTATLDPARVEAVRRQFPALAHRRVAPTGEIAPPAPGARIAEA